MVSRKYTETLTFTLFTIFVIKCQCFGLGTQYCLAVFGNVILNLRKYSKH